MESILRLHQVMAQKIDTKKVVHIHFLWEVRYILKFIRAYTSIPSHYL